MLAVAIEDGAPAVVERPEPEPGYGHIVIAMRAAGLNAADLLQARGRYPAPPGAPRDLLGLEVAGEVSAVGPGVSRWKVGDAVMTLVGGGGQAELVEVHERLALPVPERFGWEQAGGFTEVYTTAFDALFSQCGLKPAERLCVHGAAGGVGMAAVQLGLASGARVTATVRRADNRPAVAALGAEVVAPEDFRHRGPFDVILELVGGPNLQADVESLADCGRISVIGLGAGARAEVDLRHLMSSRGSIMGSTLRARSLEERALAARKVEAHVLPLAAKGIVKVPVFASYRLTEAPAAYADFAAGGKIGKIVLVSR